MFPALLSTRDDNRPAARNAAGHLCCGITSACGGCAKGLATIPSGVHLRIALGHMDMRKGMQGLALLVQQGLKRKPPGDDLFVI